MLVTYYWGNEQKSVWYDYITLALYFRLGLKALTCCTYWGGGFKPPFLGFDDHTFTWQHGLNFWKPSKLGTSRKMRAILCAFACCLAYQAVPHAWACILQGITQSNPAMEVPASHAFALHVHAAHVPASHFPPSHAPDSHVPAKVNLKSIIYLVQSSCSTLLWCS